MAIKNKDGSVYKLRGPNPLMKNQSQWDHGKVILHNLGPKTETVVDENNPLRKQQENVIDIGRELNLKPNPPVTKVVPAQDFLEDLTNEPVVAQEPPPPPPSSPPPQPITRSQHDGLTRLLKERGVEYHCAPVVDEKVHEDDFYGSSYTLPVYGEAFVFEAIVIDQSDLELQFWCVAPLSRNSIVYQRAKGGEWDRRWWKIDRLEEKSGGHLVSCVVSDINPSFD